MLCRFAAAGSVGRCLRNKVSVLLGGMFFLVVSMAFPVVRGTGFGVGCSSIVATVGLTNMP